MLEDPDGSLLRLAASMYLGETCQGCGKTFETFESLENAVWWPHDGGRIGHRECYEAAKAGGESE